jgi:uncharacterized membrane protein
VTSSTWRKRLAVWRSRLYLYPPPDALPHIWLFWLATGLVTLLAISFSAFFIVYLTTRHSVYMTNAEDLGNMDQAIWSLLHGQLFNQTVCNIVNDTNCYSLNGITRFAIHFEPILFPVSLLYLIWPDPRMLQIVQTLVVASGAFPAFWLARLRLRNELAGVGIAALYLLYPAQQFATVSDFHAVTFTAAFLLFTLYFMYTRRTVWLFVFAVLSMACKEEIPLVIAMFGLWSILFQQRWRSGLALTLLACCWAIVSFIVIPHIFSPTGHSLVASRYASLGHTPLQIARTFLLHPISVLKQHVFEHSHFFYLRLLLTPAAYLPVLAPWIMVLALPSLAINLLSSDVNMYSGNYQYNAEIVPVLIFATIEAMVLILWVAQWVISRLNEQFPRTIPQKAATSVEVQESTQEETKAPPIGMNTRPVAVSTGMFSRRTRFGVHAVLLTALVFLVLFNVVKADSARGTMPFSEGFRWPVATAHTELAQHFIDMIPPQASVSAQSALVPHLSHRKQIYLFPYGDNYADYILLDVTSDIYPFYSHDYVAAVKKVLLSGNYGILAAQDGYLLLKRGLPSATVSPYSPFPAGENALVNFPDSFCTFIHSSPQQISNPLQVTFTSTSGPATTLNLVGYGVAAPSTFSMNANYIQITTYWQISAPTTLPVQIVALIVDKNGKEHFASTYFPALSWCPTTTWTPGTVFRVTSGAFFIGAIPKGLAHVSIALVPLAQPYSTIINVHSRLALHIVKAPMAVADPQRTNALQLDTITLVP